MNRFNGIANSKKSNIFRFRLIGVFFCIMLTFCLSACGGTESKSKLNMGDYDQSGTRCVTIDTREKITLTSNSDSMEAYEKFINNEAKLSFDRCMPTDYRKNALYENGSEYTLSEVLDIVADYYLEHSTRETIDYIDYGYIDCGNDGVKELVLCFSGLDIYSKDDGSTLVYVIKYMDEKLYLCYYYETWARSHSTINEYGYYESCGSGGASNHVAKYGLIDKDGNWQPIVSIENETNINQLAFIEGLEQIPKVAKAKGVSENIKLVTMVFENNVDDLGESNYKENVYTFYVYDDNWDLIEDVNLYRNSIYKEIFDEAMVPFVTPEEALNIISQKEKDVGVTDKIKEGKEVIWKVLIEPITSDQPSYDDVTYEIYASLNESMPEEYRFFASGLDSEQGNLGFVMGLKVYNENNVLILSEDFSKTDDTLMGYPVYSEMMDTMGLHVVDVNFDGYKDVIILNNFFGAHANTWYDCWLWDANSSSYVFSESFTEICNPALDRDNKCIYSSGGSSAAYWGGKIYKFINGEFILTNELYTDWDGLVESKLMNDKMEIVRQVKYGEDEQVVMDEMEYYKNHELWQLDNPHWYRVGGHHADRWLE